MLCHDTFFSNLIGYSRANSHLKCLNFEHIIDNGLDAYQNVLWTFIIFLPKNHTLSFLCLFNFHDYIIRLKRLLNIGFCMSSSISVVYHHFNKLPANKDGCFFRGLLLFCRFDYLFWILLEGVWIIGTNYEYKENRSF